MTSIRSRKSDAKKPPLINKIPSNPQSDISDADKWKIIEQSGVLKKASLPDEDDDDYESNTLDYVLQAIFLAIPFSMLFATFQVTVQVQYNEPWTYYQMGNRMLHVMPGKNSTYAYMSSLNFIANSAII
jgi:hypothetical protein